MLFVSIPEVTGLFSAGKPIFSDYYEILRYRKIPRPLHTAPSDQLYLARVSGDSLLDVRIADGDWIVFKATSEANAGRLCVVSTPHGLTVKFIWPHLTGAVILRSANPEYPDQVWEQSEIQIRGIVVQSGRDW